jgi:hypothetical protein
MSLYIGKVNGQNVLHLTKGSTSLPSIKTNSPIYNTIIHSNSPFMIAEYHGRGYGRYVPVNQYSSDKWVIPTPTSYQNAVRVKDALSMMIGHSPYGDKYFVPDGLTASVFPGMFGAYPCSGWNTISSVEVAWQRGPKDKYSKGNQPYVDFYTVTMLTPKQGQGIRIAENTLNIGGLELKNNMFVSFGKTNNVDANVTLPGIGDVQILNSKKDSTGYGGISLNNKMIAATLNGKEYPIFDDTIKTICGVKHITNASGIYIGHNGARCRIPAKRASGIFYVRISRNGLQDISTYLFKVGVSTQNPLPGCGNAVSRSHIYWKAGYDGGSYIYYYNNFTAVFYELA